MDVELGLEQPRQDKVAGASKDETVALPNRALAIHLISQEDMPSCPFWIGLFQKGSLSANVLFESKNFEEVFERAAREGLAESAPVMLSDSMQSPTRYMYLLPEPGHEIKRRAEWIHSLITTITAWSSPKVGIYLAPALVSQKLMHELLQQILTEAMEKTKLTDYYLQTSTHGMNSILNTALKIKAELDSIEAYVFH